MPKTVFWGPIGPLLLGFESSWIPKMFMLQFPEILLWGGISVLLMAGGSLQTAIILLKNLEISSHQHQVGANWAAFY